MANTISILSFANTFGDWLISTNSLVQENNNLAANNYHKNTGTLYLDSNSLALQSNGNAVFAQQLAVQGTGSSLFVQNNANVGNQVYLTNTALSLWSAGQLQANGSGIGLVVSNNAVFNSNISVLGSSSLTGNVNLSNNLVVLQYSQLNTLTANSLNTTQSASIGGDLSLIGSAYVTNLIANTKISASLLSVSGAVVFNSLQANSSVNTGILTVSSGGYFDTVQAYTKIDTPALTISNTATVNILQANSSVNTSTLSVTGTGTVNNLQANSSVNTATLSVTGTGTVNNLQANSSVNTSTLSVTGTGTVNNLQANSSVNTATLYVTNAVNANNASAIFNNIQTIGQFTVGGNFVIQGSTVYNTNTFSLSANVTNAVTSYYNVNRGITGANASIRWNETSKYWDLLDVGVGGVFSRILTANMMSDSVSTANSSIIASANSVKITYDLATTANNNANSAGVYANLAISNANSASVYANLAISNANSASVYANTGINNANSASVYANLAISNANSASIFANTGINNANSASVYANTGIALAITANNNANSASIYANTGINNAASASFYANTANGIATSALNLAQSAYNAQNGTAIIANTKYSASGGTIAGSVTINGDLSILGNVVANVVGTTTTNIAGGANNRILYNTAANTTNFLTAPSVDATVLTYTGGSIAWAPTPTTVAQALNITGGAANRIVYNTLANTTNFLTAPSVDATVLTYTGGSITWAALPSASANLTGEVTSVGTVTTMTNANVISKILTGYSNTTGIVSSSDSIFNAIRKVDGNLGAEQIRAINAEALTEKTANKNVTNGYLGLNGWYAQLRNLTNTVWSYLGFQGTGPQTWYLPDRSGNISLDDAPVFSAYATTNQSIPATTSTIINFTGVNYDTIGGWAGSYFQPSVAGYYQINVTMSIWSGTAVNTFLLLNKNNAGYCIGVNIAGGQTGTGYISQTISTLVFLNGSTDFINVRVFNNFAIVLNSAAQSGAYYTMINGALVRRA